MHVGWGEAAAAKPANANVVRYDTDGKLIDETHLLKQAGLVPGVYVTQLLLHLLSIVDPLVEQLPS